MRILVVIIIIILIGMTVFAFKFSLFGGFDNKLKKSYDTADVVFSNIIESCKFITDYISDKISQEGKVPTKLPKEMISIMDSISYNNLYKEGHLFFVKSHGVGALYIQWDYHKGWSMYFSD